MTRAILGQFEEGIIELDEQHDLIKFTWKDKYLGMDRFKEIVSSLAAEAEKYHPKFIFVDARKIKVTISKDTQEWRDQEIVPRYCSSGVQAMAFLNPESVFSEMTHKMVFNKAIAKNKLEVGFFKTETEALSWFSSVIVS